MALLKILLFPDPRLRTLAEPVMDFDNSLKKLSEDMIETMYEGCLLYTSPSPRDQRGSRMPSSA